MYLIGLIFGFVLGQYVEKNYVHKLAVRFVAFCKELIKDFKDMKKSYSKTSVEESRKIEASTDDAKDATKENEQAVEDKK